MISAHAAVKFSELREIRAFRNLPDEQVQVLASVMVRRDYVPGQIIFLEGDQASSLWFVYSGRVKIIKLSTNGRIQGLCLMNRGKCFGSCPLFDMKRHPATAQALDDVTLFVLPNDTLEQLKTHSAQLINALLHVYSERLEHLARVSEVLGAWTVSDRINDCILTYASPSAEHLIVNLTHEKLATLSGTVREVVTRHLNLLEKEGVVRTENGHIIVLNRDALLPPCNCEN